MDKETDMTETKRQIEVMKAYEEGKTIQYRGKCTKDDVWNDTKFPSWNWYSVDYRVKPDEAKKLMTYRQLSELITKGYGQWLYNYDNAVMGKNTLFIDKEVNENILIRPWGLDKLVRPTVDIYEEFMKRKAEADTIKDYSGASKAEPSIGEVFKCWGRTFKCIASNTCDECSFSCKKFRCHPLYRKDGRSVSFVDVSKMENTTSEESSATVSKEESVGLHRRTPQEIADFFNCYVAYDPFLFRFIVYEKRPVFSDEIGWNEGSYNSSFELDGFVTTTDSCKEKNILYRPHLVPIVVEEKDRPGCAALAMGTIGSLAEKEEDDDD